jgi:hypothetical protein
MNLIDALKGEYPGIETLTRPQIQSVALKYSLQKQFTDFMTNPHNKVKRGLYKVSVSAIDGDAFVYNTQESSVPKTTMKNVDKISTSVENSNSLIPQIDKSFIKFGDYNLLKKIIKSNSFHPVYITGESGNGKTKMVYQACAENHRELIRANITETTDEDDLVGGFRLVNGETVWQDGPAVAAMKTGAVLLLDELNLASPKIMCLQPILEGNPIYIKKTNTTVFPQPGFNIIATANTKGKSSEDGRYIGSNTQNEALLDRFAITFEHEYPPVTIETQILEAILKTNNAQTQENLTFVKNLVEWAKIIRETYDVGGVEEIVSTRRLIHILNTTIITGMDRVKAIRYCISRFDEDTKKSFYSLYQKVDDSVQINSSGQILESEDDKQ